MVAEIRNRQISDIFKSGQEDLLILGVESGIKDDSEDGSTSNREGENLENQGGERISET